MNRKFLYTSEIEVGNSKNDERNESESGTIGNSGNLIESIQLQ